MTPFIDVMLVLLIIFMVAAPLLTVGVPLDLPQTQATALNIDKQPLTISVKADGKIYLMETAIAIDEIVPKLTASPRRARTSASMCAATRRPTMAGSPR